MRVLRGGWAGVARTAPAAEEGVDRPALRGGGTVGRRHLMPAASVTAWVQAPFGSLEMTGVSPPAVSRVLTVRS